MNENPNEKVIAVGLDGVLAMYDHWRGIDQIGAPLPGAVEFTRALSKLGRVMIYTVRCSATVNAPTLGVELVERVRNWLDEHGFSYDEIWSEVGKPLYNVLIDDRAVHCNPQDDPGGAYELAISQATILIVDQDARDADEKDEAPPEDIMPPAGEQTNLPPEMEIPPDASPSP